MMNRWNFLFGLTALIWAQTSTAWKWYSYTQETYPDPNIAPTPTIWSARKGAVRYVNDTVYVMGTYRGWDGTNMGLPDTTGSTLSPTISGAGNYERTYLAAYDRRTGALLWWMYFHHGTGSTWGQDIAVAPDGTLYLLIIGHPAGLSWNYATSSGGMASGSWNPYGISGARASHLLKIRPYASPPVVASVSIGLNVTGTSNSCDLKHLLLIGNNLYASGEFQTSTVSNLLLESGGTTTLFNISSLTNTHKRGLLIWWNLNANPNLTGATAAQLRYESTAGNADVIGHRLAYDAATNHLRWLVEMQDVSSPAYRALYYDLSSGGTSSTNISGAAGNPYTLRVLSLAPNLTSPSTPNYHNLSQSNIALGPESPYLHSYNDTLVWSHSTWSTFNLIDQSSTTTIYGTFGYDHVILVEQKLVPSGNNAQLIRYLQVPFAKSLHLSGMAVERNGDLVYLSGAANDQSWGPGNSLPLGLRNNSRSGFLMGLRRTLPGYQPIGYRRFFSVDGSRDSVEVIGMAYDSSLAQFYLLGTAQDSLLLRPTWPMGMADTIRPSPNNGVPERLWVGRLDWYRLMTAGNHTKCTPDTIAPSSLVKVTGKNVHSSDVPPGIPAGWRFGWIPAAQPWRSTIAPLDIIGPIMGIQEGTYTYMLSLVAKGSYQPGSYYLAGTVYPVMRRLWVDILDTLKLNVPGTTIPSIRRTTSTASTFMITPYAGKPSAGYISGPYPQHRSSSWKFQFINALYYHPSYYAPPAYQGREMLFVITHTIPHQIWGINLGTGMVDSLPVPNTSNAYRYFMDPVRGTYWAHEIPDGNIYAARIRRAPFTATSDVLIYQGTTCVPTVGSAYPLRYTQAWLKDIHRAAVLPNGDFVFIADACPNAKYSLWRVSLATDSVYRVTGYTILGSTCPQDGIGNSAIIGYFPYTNLAVWGDTVYWIENAFASTCLSLSGNYMLIRKAYPHGSITSYKVETLDTIPYSGSVAEYLLFSPLPTPALIFGTYGTNEAMIRFDLYTRARDTLIRCLGGSTFCCSYGLSDWITGLTHTAAILRGGAIVIERFGSLRLAVPIALSGSGDTLSASTPVGSVTAVGGAGVTPTFSGSTVQFGWPSASGPGLDSTYLAISLSSCNNGKPLYYPFYHLPKFGVWLKAPDTVCLGQVFHSYVGRDTEVVDNGCRVSHRLFQVATSQGNVSQLMGGNEVHRWRAIQVGYDTIRSVIAAPKWSYLVSVDSLSHPIRIRQGYRLRLTTALEGSYNSTFLHKRHPFLTRYNLGAYNQGILGVSSDSLWRLPYLPGDSLMKAWNTLLIEPSGPCPGAGTWYCDTAWTTLARVELRENVSGPVVDSTYALIDSAGRLYFYGAPLSSIGSIIGSADTLHFCHCNPSTPKYLTVRFPNHLPLHTPALSLSLRGIGEADSIDLQDPTYLDGIPGEHYTFLPGPGSTLRVAAWAGNCADLHNAFIPGGAHVDAGWINAADYDFVVTRNGITSGFSIGDLNSDGQVNALDAVIVIQNQNHLRQSSHP